MAAQNIAVSQALLAWAGMHFATFCEAPKSHSHRLRGLSFQVPCLDATGWVWGLARSETLESFSRAVLSRADIAIADLSFGDLVWVLMGGSESRCHIQSVLLEARIVKAS